MKLQSKIAETYKLKQEEKRKLNRKNGRELSHYKLYTIHFSRWGMEISFEIGLGDVPPPLHFTSVLL